MRKCALPRSWLDNAIRFSTHSRVSGFPRHSFKWARQFSHFLQYTSGLEVLASSFYTGFNYVYAPTALFLEPPSKVAVKISKLTFRVYSLRQRYITPVAFSPGPEAPCQIFWQNAQIFETSSWVSCSILIKMLLPDLYAISIGKSII